MDQKLTIAAFGAHPDDIEGDMIGTLIKYKEQGHRIEMIVATDGCKGGIVEVRKEEAIAAAAHIGVEPRFLGFEDGRLVYDRGTYQKVIEIYETISPDLIFTHDPNDYHADHRAISRLVTDASWVPVFFSDTAHGVNFNPEFYVDITKQFDLKKKTLAEHRSQKPDNLIKSVEIQNRFRGLQCGRQEVEYAEAFRIYPRHSYVTAYQLLP